MFLSISSRDKNAKALSYILQKNPAVVYSRARREAWNKIKQTLVGSNVSDDSLPVTRKIFLDFCEKPTSTENFVGQLKLSYPDTKATDQELLRISLQLNRHLNGLAEEFTLFFPVYNEQENFYSAVCFSEFPEYKLWDKDVPGADAYVTSKEYALSSLFCRELKDALRTAISGKYRTEEDQKNADTPLDLIIELLPFVTNLPDTKIMDLFRPLGYSGYSPTGSPIGLNNMVVDHSYKNSWQPQKSRVVGLTLQTKKTIKEVLQQFLILIPVIDNFTHVTVLDDLPTELKNFGASWLETHPMKDFISVRFLRYQKRLIDQVSSEEEKKVSESEMEGRLSLGEYRQNWFVSKVKESSPRSVVDAGCGSGRLAEALVKENILEVSAFDCHAKALGHAHRFLKGKANVFFSSLMYFDRRLLNKDMIVLCEVIEHLSDFVLTRTINFIFKIYKPKMVLMSTPNIEHNKFFNILEGQFRHPGHKWEWTKQQGIDWGSQLAKENNYIFEWEGIGQEKEGIYPTQGLIFIRK